MNLFFAGFAALGLLLPSATEQPLAGAPVLWEQQLTREDVSALAKAVRQQGDAQRGAVLFFQPYLTCIKCHASGDEASPLGPDLAKMGKEGTATYILESLLSPSKVIKKGYETVTIQTRAGKTLTGLVVEERANELVIRDSARDFKPVTIAKKDIEERTTSPVSIMPAGLVNQLANRQQFLDLVRYLMEIAEHGPARARELRPAPSLFAAPPLPDYERDLDHAGMIAAFDAQGFQRGQAIYDRVCINCHGTKDRPGSLPTSLAFATGAFQNGSDPYSMYQTLTHGFRQMTPQPWMVPQQKYDVIHYVRQAYLKKYNPTQYVRVEPAYLRRLPTGTSRGPAPSNLEPWVTMDYGPSLIGTYEIGQNGSNYAYKGIAVRLDVGPGGVSRGKYWMIFDHDTMRLAAAWSGQGFIDWNGVNFNGRHESIPRLAGTIHVANPVGPGWADPQTGRFDDPRLRGRDGRPYGPLPRRWAHYQGLYHAGHQVVVSYTVGVARILESPGYELDPSDKNALVFTRTLSIEPAPHELLMRVAPVGTAVAVVGSSAAKPFTQDGYTLLRIPPSPSPVSLKVLMSNGSQPALAAYARTSPQPASLASLTAGGPRRWPEVLTTKPVIGTDQGPFAVDVLTHPASNPWLCQLRLSGFDFFPDGDRAAVCSWDGDVWLVTGLDKLNGSLTWQRIASGLFQPLGLKIVDGKIYVGCRDQIVILHDLNGDGETDFYENFNNDHQVTAHFHEFAMDLQTDAAGNFYYAKGGRHALKAVVPHHGTLLRVSKDGSHTDILATGFRAANGVCLNPDGTFFLTDQEGHWTPKNRINWVHIGGFYGYMWGYHNVKDPADAAMEQPVCWITNSFDRSPSELVWVDSKAWGPLAGSLLNFSYGYGKIYVVPHEVVNGQMQGGMCQLPLPLLPTGVMRGRFHPHNGQLYTCGLFSWAGDRQEPGGFFRVRYTGKPVYLPVGLHARRTGMALTFSGTLDRQTATDASRYAVKTWSLRRAANYGSPHINERPVKVTRATLSEDGRTVFLEIPDIKPTWCMEIKYAIRGATGENIDGMIHNTVHQLGAVAE